MLTKMQECRSQNLAMHHQQIPPAHTKLNVVVDEPILDQSSCAFLDDPKWLRVKSITQTPDST
jgi:hypothetical protein